MPTDPSAESRLNNIIAEYLQAVDAGQKPDCEPLLAQYPDLADALRSFFVDHDRMKRVAGVLPSTVDLSETLSRDAPLGEVRYFGDYELLEEIARGGMGVVYKARQVSLNRTVALKMILAGQLASPKDVQRFHSEAEAAANLDHPNIVPIYEIGEHEGQHYFSMKRIDGGNLAQHMKCHHVDPRSAVQLLATVARAVHYAHQRGVIHRDLKPANILLSFSRDPKGSASVADALPFGSRLNECEPHITDFGLAKRIEGGDHLTQPGVIVGTPSYMAPEQARAEKNLSTTVDICSLGAILYELLTGRPPFRAETHVDTILRVLDHDPLPPRALNPRIDRDLETICLKCLEKEPKNRYGAALAVAEDLENWLASRPIQARPSGPAKRLLKWAKRNPPVAALLVVLALWLFDLRLSWRWMNWFSLAGSGLFVLWRLWRLVVVCGRAVGKFPNTPLDLFSDCCVGPGVLLSVLAIWFYRRDAVAAALSGIVIDVLLALWGWMFQWLRRSTLAGPLLAALRPPLPIVILAGFGFGILSILSGGVSLYQAPRTGDPLFFICFGILQLSAYISLFLIVAVGTEFRKQGCVTSGRFIPWEQIESYDWRFKGNMLFLRFKVHTTPFPFKTIVPPAKKEMVDEILRAHVPQIGQGDTKAANFL